MSASLAKRPLAAAGLTIIIVVTVGIIAAFFPSATTYRAALSPEPDLPGYGEGVEPAFGRQFEAIEATEQGRPHDFPGRPPTITFFLDGVVEIYSGCNYTGGKWRLRDGRIDPISASGWSMLLCEGPAANADEWMAKFLERRPRWQLDGDALTLSSGFGSMTLVDKGAGRNPDDLVGNRFQEWGPTPKARGKSLIDRPNSLWITFADDGTLRASLGCETVVAEVDIQPGWMKVREELVPRKRSDCSPSMKAQRTDWLWEFLREPLRWQSLQGWLALRTNSNSVGFGSLDFGQFAKREHRTNLAAISGRTFRSTWIDGGGAVRAGIEEGRGITITVRTDGTLIAGVGCDRPTIRAEVRTGWLRFEGATEPSADACSKPDAERWLAEFFATQPFWRMRFDGLAIRSEQTMMELIDEVEYAKVFGDS